MTREILYDLNSAIIVMVLLAFILATYEIAYRLGRYYHRTSDEALKAQTNTIQAGILGLLALLLGFTFNMALQRFDNRTQAVIEEANAIGTTMLRTRLLPAPYDSIAYELLKHYTDKRILISGIDLTREAERLTVNQETDQLQKQIWDIAIQSALVDPRPMTSIHFITSLNEMIDLRGKRNAILQRHVPEVILMLLFLVFIINGGLMGYSSGLSLRRAYVPTILLNILFALVVFIIIDLDRPKRGLIKVNQDSLTELPYHATE